MDVVRGYARVNEQHVRNFANVGSCHWQQWAEEEIRRRTTSIFDGLDIKALEAIADGTVDFQALCQKAITEIQIHQT